MVARKLDGANDARAAAQRGSALVMVLLLAFVVSAIGGTLLLSSNSDHHIAANERDSERALYAANAGISYAYDLFTQGALAPSESGDPFNSFATAVNTAMEGAEFTGRIYDLSVTIDQGQIYRIESTGTFNQASRTTEMVFQNVADAFLYGYVAFSGVTLHNHSGYAGPDFRIASTILSNGDVSVPDDVTIDGAIVAAGKISVSGGSIITRDVFANEVSNSGTIQGSATLLSSVDRLPSSATSWDILDNRSVKYDWLDGNSTPGSFSGTAPVGGTTSYTIQAGEMFKFDLFNRVGALLPVPDVNVTQYTESPKIDYAAMYATALEDDMTYFTSQEDLLNYFISKKVVEVIGGKTLTTVRVGTPDAPEFIYLDDGLAITLDPGGGDDASGGTIDADGIFIEGGIYITGDWDFNGPDMVDPLVVPQYPLPPDYYALSINALDYCFPALLVYEQPAAGVITDWGPEDTPAIGGGPKINMSASGDEGPTLFNGVMYGQGDIHLHHTKDNKELIYMNGTEMANNIHNCDFLAFTYDPRVRCTRFLSTDGGTAEVVAYREIR